MLLKCIVYVFIKFHCEYCSSISYIVMVASNLDALDVQINKCVCVCLYIVFKYNYKYKYKINLKAEAATKIAKFWEPKDLIIWGKHEGKEMGFPRLYFHYHFMIIITWKGSFIVGWLRLGKGLCLYKKIQVVSMPLTLSL